ncbi:MAG: guanylate kinase [Dehalococcoidales bacterium]|nr:guanylate kinase [Dehalococcoidales bacterium]
MEKATSDSQPLFSLPARPLFVILSGPSGVGKDAVLNRIKETGYPLKYITTLTTRPPRAKEKNNVDYHFVSTEKFKEMKEKNQLLEWAEVYGNWYGVPKEAAIQALREGQDVMVKVDIQGAESIKKIIPQAITIFLMPPSLEELLARLKRRRTELSFDLDLRLKTAEKEMKQLSRFDYAIVNRSGEIDLAVAEIKAIITAEKCRVTREEIMPKPPD